VSGSPGTLLFVEDDSELQRQMRIIFRQTCRVEAAGSREAAKRLLSDSSLDPDVAVVDMHLPPKVDSIEEGLLTLRDIAALRPETVLIAMSGDEDRETVFQAVEAGVYDFFDKPIDTRELEIIVRRAMERRRLVSENRSLRRELAREYHFENFIGRSPAMTQVLATIRKVADSNATVLIHGESGTGKELVARALHANGRRADGPFVGVNCSAIPETLIESELFGHEKGSFTGAVERRLGRFEQARGGTLFLDELATLTPAAQAKLLRVLETREFERVGGKETVPVDIRLVVATNKDLEKEVAEGRFREDLYYRVRVVSLYLPPLRERREDIPALLAHYLERAAADNGVPQKRMSPTALDRLVQHGWKGNVRELRHVIESLVLLSEGDTIEASDLPPQIVGASLGAGFDGLPDLPDQGFALEEHLARHERDILRAALRKADGVKTRAAKVLGVNKDRMKYLCRKYDL
jgi:two-component system response regulator PilR (NtrC family)